MQPPHRDHQPWRDDRLGRLLRQGMPRGWRHASPSPEVWQRIACEISPHPPATRSRRPGWLRPGWLRPGASRPRVCGGPRWVSFSSSALVLSTALMVGLLMIGDIGAVQPRSSGDPCRDHVAGDCGAAGAPDGPASAPSSAPSSAAPIAHRPRIAGAPPQLRVARVDPVTLMDPVALVTPVESLIPRPRWTFRFSHFEVAPFDRRALQAGEDTQANPLFNGWRAAPQACAARGLGPEANPAMACIY